MTQPDMSIPVPDELSLRDRAYDLLRRLLILQQIPEGERLREPHWAKQLGVNRTALREAFARLEAEGLIERGPKTGYFVPKLSEDDIHEIWEVRAALEATAAERIIREKRTTPKHLAVLHQAIDDLQTLIDDGYLLGASEADRRFHERLIELAGNRRLEMIYRRAPLPMIHAGIANSPNWEREMRRTLAEHRTICDLIAAGQAAAVAQAIRSHLMGATLPAITDASPR